MSRVETEPTLPGIPAKFGVLKEEVDGNTAIRVKWNLPPNSTVNKFRFLLLIDVVGSGHKKKKKKVGIKTGGTGHWR